MGISGTGEVVRTTNIEVRKIPVDGTAAITKGDWVTFNSDGHAILPTAGTTTITQGFYVALEAADNTNGSDGDITVNVAMGNTYVTSEAGGAIKGFQLLELEDAQECIVNTMPASALTPDSTDIDDAAKYFGLSVGRYVGKLGDSNGAVSAASDGDVIIVRLGL